MLEAIVVKIEEVFENRYSMEIIHKDDKLSWDEIIEKYNMMVSTSIENGIERNYFLYTMNMFNNIPLMKKNEIEEFLKEVDRINEDYGKKVTPEEYYKSLKKLPFVVDKKNYYIYHMPEYGHYNSSFNTSLDYGTSGLEYVSESDAIEFCKRFNK